jgi:hypothetical protein
MQEDSLLVARLGLPDGSFIAREHDEIYVNLANRMKITGMNQVWVAVITFIRLKKGIRVFGGPAR